MTDILSFRSENVFLAKKINLVKCYAQDSWDMTRGMSRK